MLNTNKKKIVFVAMMWILSGMKILVFGKIDVLKTVNTFRIYANNKYYKSFFFYLFLVTKKAENKTKSNNKWVKKKNNLYSM